MILAEFVKDVSFWDQHPDWLPVSSCLCYGILVGLPFLLARMAPRAASFDTQWLPVVRRHWAWLPVMIFLIFLAKVFIGAAVSVFVDRLPPRPFAGPVTPAGIVLWGVAAVVAAPIGEEVFFRGYVLDQLQKLMRSGLAVTIQAILFGLFHLYTRGLFTSFAVLDAVVAFWVGMVLGGWRVRFRCLVPLMLAHAAGNGMVLLALKARYDHVTGRTAPIRHTISVETTRITGPLRADGSVDYVAALNERSSEGVTLQNNAAVPFWKAVGPAEILPEFRAKYFHMLGMRPPRGKGDYFVDFDHFVADRRKDAALGRKESTGGADDDRSDLLSVATMRPWSRREFPILAQWIAANEEPLALLAQASTRPRQYDPLCAQERMPLIATPLPNHMLYRDVARAFCARAMLRVGEGRTAEAWEDLLCCHRLARLIGQGPTTIEAMGASAVEETACLGDRGLLQYARQDVTQSARMREDLERLPPMPKMADKIDVAERFTFLDLVSNYSREGISSVIKFCDELAEFDVAEAQKLKETVGVLRQSGNDTLIDWDLVLRMGNAWFDRLVDAYRTPTGLEQGRALRRLDEDLQRLKRTAADAEVLRKRMPGNPSKAISERLGQVLLTFHASDPTLFIQSEKRWMMRLELAKLGFALAVYRDRHGVYPEKLADLTPTDVARIPEDFFSGSGLRYRRDGDGYLLYSVGQNGKSDGARGYEDRKNQEDWDDLVIRVPVQQFGGKR
ncbi:MAG: CPBP family intramembrane glutamic endopeptidase [Thermoguttaceae bacterium]